MIYWSKKDLLVLFIILVASVISTVVVYASIGDPIMQKFAQEEGSYKLPSGILAKVAMIESKGNAYAKAPNSSASGLFQWLDRSWYDASAARYGSPRNLNDRFNPFIATEVTAFALRQNENKNGSLFGPARVDRYTGIYFGHLLGIGGARTFLSALSRNENTSAASVAPKAAAGNPSIFCGGCTLRQVANKVAQKMGQQGVTSVAYNGTYSQPQGSRIMDDAGYASLSRSYSGGVPPIDSRMDNYTTGGGFQTSGSQPNPETPSSQAPANTGQTEPAPQPTDPKKEEIIKPLDDPTNPLNKLLDPEKEKTDPAKPKESEEPEKKSTLDKLFDFFTGNNNKSSANTAAPTERKQADTRGIGNTAGSENGIKTIISGGAMTEISSPFRMAPSTFQPTTDNDQYARANEPVVIYSARSSLNTLQTIVARIRDVFFR